MHTMKPRYTSAHTLGDHLGWLVIPAISSTALLVGCVPAGVQILHLETDPALKVEQLEKERVAILPALASTPMMDARALAPLREQLASQLVSHRPSIALVDKARMDGALHDHPQIAPSLDRFARTHALSFEHLHQLGTATGARFIVITVFSEYSFGWGGRPAPKYSGDHAGLAFALGGMVGLGIFYAVGETRTATLRSTAEARLVGSISIFDTKVDRNVWIGVAMVSQEVETSHEVPASNARTSDVPIANPPEVTQLTPLFLEALVDRWPS